MRAINGKQTARNVGTTPSALLDRSNMLTIRITMDMMVKMAIRKIKVFETLRSANGNPLPIVLHEV